jgi:hypothetical protein
MKVLFHGGVLFWVAASTGARFARTCVTGYFLFGLGFWAHFSDQAARVSHVRADEYPTFWEGMFEDAILPQKNDLAADGRGL